MGKYVLLTFLLAAPTAFAAIVEAVAPGAATWPQYVGMLTPLVLFLMGWAVRPMLTNIVDEKVEQVKAAFFAMEKEAHGDIIKVIAKSQEDFSRHNTDPFAHPNLSAYEKLTETMRAFGEDLAALREEVSAMRARVTRPARKK
jgi:hypothetical protein